MAKALDCWNYELMNEPEGFRQVLGGAGKDINVVTQLPSQLYSDVDAIDIYRDEIFLEIIRCSMLVLQCHDSAVKMHLFLKERWNINEICFVVFYRLQSYGYCSLFICLKMFGVEISEENNK